jgi:circadian clock protein KaiB
MAPTDPKNVLKHFEQALNGKSSDHYSLRLYVAGTTPRSLRAIQNTKRICDEKLTGRYDLEIIDVYQQASMAAADQIVAVPTLLKVSPGPLRRLIGDLSNESMVLIGLGLVQVKGTHGF